jgi:hypothetical protein
MDKGNVDKYRRSMSGLRVTNAETHGRNLARERYGRLQYDNTPPPAPKDQSAPQKLGDANNLRDKSYQNDVPENSWLRGGGKGGEGYPGYVPGYRGKK